MRKDLQSLLLLKNKRLALILFSLLYKKRTYAKNFDLNAYDDDECKRLFRFRKKDIITLRKLLRIPWKIKCSNRTICSGTEGICILLRRLAYPCRFSDLNLLESLDQPWLTTFYLQMYSDAVARKGAPLLKCWGFIDGTVRPMCRPGKYQKDCYNGHKRVHALKYQSLVIPNGLIANVFGPVEGRRHDSYLLSESRLLDQLATKNANAHNAEPFCIYGDPAYPLRPELQAPYKGSRLTEEQALFNKRMSAVRIAVEWGFGKVLQLFAFVDFKKNQKLYLQPLSKYFKVAVILTNAHTCLYGSNVSNFFDLTPPTIQEYFNYF